MVCFLFLHVYYSTGQQTGNLCDIIIDLAMMIKPKDNKRIEEDKFLMINQHLKNALKLPSFQPTTKFLEQTFSYLESKLKSSQLLYQQALEYYLNAYLIFYSVEERPEINVYSIFSKILLLHTDVKEDIQKDWQEYYRAIRTPAQQIRERKFLYLVKCILSKYRIQTLQSKSRMGSLIKKAIEKEFSSIGLQILVAYYFFAIYRSALYGQQSQMEIVYEPLSHLYTKNRTLWANTYYKLISENYQNSSYLVSILLGSMNLILKSPRIYLSMISESLMMNEHVKSKLMGEKNIALGEVHLNKITQSEKYEKYSTLRALIVLYGRMILRLLEEETKLFIEIVQNTREYFKSVPAYFEVLIDQIILLSLSNGFQIRGASFDSNTDVLINRYKQDPRILLLLFQFCKGEQYFLKELGNLRQGILKQFVNDVVEMGLQEYLQASTSQEIQVVLINTYTTTQHTGLQRLVTSRLLGICQQPKQPSAKIKLVRQLMNSLNGSALPHSSKLQPSHLTSIIKISQSLLSLYFHHDLQISILSKYKTLMLGQEKYMLSFVNILFKLLCSIQEPIVKQRIVDKDANKIAGCLLDKIDISIVTRRPVETFHQHPMIPKAVLLLEALLLPSHTETIKKVYKLFFDRPSEYVIESKIIKNRFLLRCAIGGQVAHILKTVYEILQKMQDNQHYLKILFPKITDQQARKVYLEYLSERKLAQFRVEREKYPEFKEYMLQQ